MKLAREFRRPDWRAMLAGMSSTEYADWRTFYQDNFFNDVQLDAHFSSLMHIVITALDPKTTSTPASFSLLSPSAEDIANDEHGDAVLMAKAEGISGGVRYGPDGSG
ncbi:phage tail assembly protein T [Salmonella enterica subsp. enterica]|nr:phage tail assembly protein T [Salmonella enterica subsp. enterica]